MVYKLQLELLNSSDICVSWSLSNTDLENISFKLKFSEGQFSSKGTILVNISLSFTY